MTMFEPGYMDPRAPDNYEEPIEPRKAWDLIGWDDGLLTIVGGRAVYELVSYHDDTPGGKVRLGRIVGTPTGLRVVNRYVDPDTLLLPAGETSRYDFEDYGR